MANKPVVVLSSRAQKQIAESWIWYEERQNGLGDRFVKEVAGRILKIEQNPERFPLRNKYYRETPVTIFPYLIIYRFNKKTCVIAIVAVFHTSLNPKKKYR